MVDGERYTRRRPPSAQALEIDIISLEGHISGLVEAEFEVRQQIEQRRTDLIELRERHQEKLAEESS